MPIFNTEKELEDKFYEEILMKKVNPLNGFSVSGVARQVNLGAYGVADLVTIESGAGFTQINVIELKNVKYHPMMAFQVARYMQAVKCGADYTNFLDEDYIRHVAGYDGDLSVKFHKTKVVGSLVCPQVDLSLFDKGDEAALDFLGITVYDFCLDGFRVEFSSTNCGEPCHSFCFDSFEKIQESLSELEKPIKPAIWRPKSCQ